MARRGGLSGDEEPRGRQGEEAEDARDDGTATDATTSADSRGGSTPATQQVGRIVLVVLALLFVFFAVDNAQPVDFSWIFGETQVREVAGEERGGVPLIVLLSIAFVLGAAIGSIATRLSQRRRARAD